MLNDYFCSPPDSEQTIQICEEKFNKGLRAHPIWMAEYPQSARGLRPCYHFVFAGGEPFCDGVAATVFGFSFLGFLASFGPFPIADFSGEYVATRSKNHAEILR